MKPGLSQSLLIAALGLAAFAAAAQPFPTKTVTIVVPVATGGGHDFTARVLAERLSTRWGQQVIVDNRAGAGGAIAAELVARAAPDGYTLIVTQPSAAVVNRHLLANLKSDPMRDLGAITLAGMTPLVMVAHPSMPVKNLDDTIRLAKKMPGKLAYATGGITSPQSIAGAWLTRLAGIDMTLVPYKGAGPATVDVVSGHVPFGILGMAPVLPQIQAGRLRAVAVLNARRVQWLPDVPAVAESPGLKEFEVTHWMGVQTGAKVPAALIRQINQAVVEVLSLPEVRQRLIGQGIQPVGNTPEQFAAFLADEDRKYARLVKLAGLKPE